MLKQKHTKVIKSNRLIQAKYKLTLNEQRLIFILISLINQDDKEFKTYQIRIQDFIDVFGLKSKKNSYDEVKETTSRLLGNTLKIEEESGTLQINWLSSAKYYNNKGYVELCFDPKLKPYLLQLKEQFTTYRLEYVLHLKSIYAIRLYELLLKEYNYYRKTKDNFVFELKKLKELLGIDKKEYIKFNHFKSRVLEPAKKELQLKSDMYFEYECLKTGRSITQIKFVIKPNPSVDVCQLKIEAPIISTIEAPLKPNDNEQSESPATLTEEQAGLVKSLLDNGFKPRVEAEKFVFALPCQEIKDTLNALQMEQKKKKIDNSGGWIRNAFKNRLFKKSDEEIRKEEQKKKRDAHFKEYKDLKNQLETLFNEYNTINSQKAHQHYKGLTDEEQNALKEQFYDGYIKDSPLLMGFYRETPMNPIIKSMMTQFITKTVLQTDFESFFKSKGHDLKSAIIRLKGYTGVFNITTDHEIEVMIKDYEAHIRKQ
ncbi:MAG: replication initiation protein [Desulfamplus sp.]|nr:replication initiation protein [Desulfamplus sp.]